MLGKSEGKRRRGTVEDEIVRQHNQFDGHKFEQSLGHSGEQGAWQAKTMGSERVEYDLAIERKQQ